jgi:hypothetical protein
MAGESLQSGNAIANWKKDIRAMRKRLDASGFQRYKNNSDHAQFQARKKISAMVKTVRGYLGN